MPGTFHARKPWPVHTYSGATIALPSNGMGTVGLTGSFNAVSTRYLRFDYTGHNGGEPGGGGGTGWNQLLRQYFPNADGEGVHPTDGDPLPQEPTRFYITLNDQYIVETVGWSSLGPASDPRSVKDINIYTSYNRRPSTGRESGKGVKAMTGALGRPSRAPGGTSSHAGQRRTRMSALPWWRGPKGARVRDP